MTSASLPLSRAAQLRVDRAAAACARIHRSPTTARRRLVELLARCEPEEPAVAIAEWGLGRLAHDAGDARTALGHFDRAAALAERADDRSQWATILVSRAVSWQAVGSTDRALQDLAAAERFAGADADLAGRLRGQRGFIFTLQGRTADALGEYDAALAAAGAGDPLATIRTLSNRGVTLLQVGRFDAAERDFVEMLRLAELHRQTLLAAGAAHNLGYLAGRRGDVLKSLDFFDHARRQYLAVGTPQRLLGALDVDHCEVLLDSGLTDEAVRIAEQLLADAPADNTLQLGDALLLAARAHLFAGHREEAVERAERAAALFRADRRRPWEALAGYVIALAGAEESSAVALRRVTSVLERQGWVDEALIARVQLGRAELRIRGSTTNEHLAEVASMPLRGPVRRRLAILLARALDADGRSDRRRLADVLRRAESLVDDHRSAVGAIDLRSAAASMVEPLAELDRRAVLRSGDPWRVLDAAERWRTATIESAWAAPAVEEASMADLRAAHRVLTDARLTGDGDAVAAAQEAIRRCEQAVTTVVRLSSGRTVSGVARRASLRGRLPGALAERLLVEFVADDGELHAIVVDGSTARIVPVGGIDAVTSMVDRQRFAHRRVLLMGARPNHVAAHRESSAQLDALLWSEIDVRDRDVVVVPTGCLHQVPWLALASVVGASSWAVAPSARWLVHHVETRRGRRRLLAVAGPSLAYADDEVERIAGGYRSATVLAGGAATTSVVVAALPRHDIVHLAAHGLFRSDNPLFSALILDDGPLTVHDLLTVPRMPLLAVLSACSAGRSTVLRGDELLGTASALLGAGVHNVIAPSMEVPDAASSDVVTALHRQLRRRRPAQALHAVVNAATDDPLVRCTAESFSCLGTGL
jgi:tetratricopeptide (TPR) repeat protein